MLGLPRPLLGLILVVSFAARLVADDLPPGAVVRVGPRSPGPAGGELDRIRLVALSPDGRRLATTGEPEDPTVDRVVHLWGVPSGEFERTLVARDAMITSMSFSPDGTRLVTGTPEHAAGTQVWDVRSGREIASAPGGTGRARFRDDGRLLIVERFANMDAILVFDANTGREVLRHVVDAFEAMDVTPDGRRVVSLRSIRGAYVYVADVATGDEVAKITGFDDRARAVAISPDGRTAAGVVGAEIVVWEVRGGATVWQSDGNEQAVLRLEFTPDGRRLVATSADRTIRLWELATGRELHMFKGHDSLVTALDVAAATEQGGERLATGSFDRTAIVWNTATTRRSFLPAERPDEEAQREIWTKLGSDRAAEAYEAIGRVEGHPGEVVAMLAGRVHGTLVPAENGRIRELVVQLDDDDFRVRHRATRELYKLRGIALPILLKTYETSPSEEVRDRIRRIVGNDKDVPRFGPDDRRRMFRIIQACEAVAVSAGETPAVTTQAIEILGEIVEEFPDADVVREARETLSRVRP